MTSKRQLFAWLLAIAHVWTAGAQINVEGFCFEENNRGFLNQVKIVAVELESRIVKGETASDMDGKFGLSLPSGRYRLLANKDLFETRADTFEVGTEKIYLKLEFRRKPGYLFDATLAEAREKPDQVVDAISGAWIEIYNRTAMRPELVLRNHPDAFFQHTFEQGNHYTILLRKSGFLSKRIEAYVNVKDCILCIEGVRDMSPGVVDNLTRGNQLGTLLSNIELERVKLDKRIQIQNIYYDYDKWDIRPDAAVRLDNVVQLMRDNPNLTVELGSHTDARGRDAYNLTLSEKRAAAAVEYIVQQGIPSDRITSKGYGETKLVNRCGNGVTCSEQEHERNRRTELRITGILEYPEAYWMSLEEMIKRESGTGPMSPTQRAAFLKQLAEGQKKSNGEVSIPAARPADPQPVPMAEEMPSNSRPEEPVLTQTQPVPAPDPYAPFTALPADYSGYAIELTGSVTLLPANAPALLGLPEIRVREEKTGYFYYILYNNRLDAAYQEFNTSIKKKNEGAKMVAFRKGEKTYLK